MSFSAKVLFLFLSVCLSLSVKPALSYDFPPPQSYTHAVSGLTYTFDTSANPPGNILALETEKDGSTVRCVFSYNNGVLFKAEIWITQAMEKLTLTGQRSTLNPLHWLIQWDFGSYGSIVYLFDQTTGQLGLQSNAISDCSALANSDIYTKLISFAGLFSNAFWLDENVPPHFVQAMTVLNIGTVGPRLLTDCQSWMDPKLCDWKTKTYQKCKSCCEDQRDGWSVFLAAADGISAPFVWLGIASLATTVLWTPEQEYQTCMAVSCQGKDGDPSCTNPQPCSDCKGVCIGGWKHACGSCTDPEKPNCCTR